MSLSPMLLPSCKQHGTMVLRVKHMTEEQKWCGVWYDCPVCNESVLFPSKELQSLYDMNNTKQER